MASKEAFLLLKFKYKKTSKKTKKVLHSVYGRDILLRHTAENGMHRKALKKREVVL
jgi:hypothetical protein